EDHDAPMAGIEEPPVHRGSAGARPAMQEQDRRTFRVSRFFPIHHMARIEPELAGAGRPDWREQAAAVSDRRIVKGRGRWSGSAGRRPAADVSALRRYAAFALHS